MHAAIFINYTIDPLAQGHLAWAFETSPGEFCYGGSEWHLGTSLEANGVFIAHGTRRQMIAAMRSGRHPHGAGNNTSFPYDAYKFIPVQNPHPSKALQLAEESKRWGYFVIANNCMDHAHKIITAYANGDLNVLPWPSAKLRPVDFFNKI